MGSASKILAFAGSLRKDSYNKKLVAVAAAGARNAGAEVTVLDLADYPLPVFSEDLEAAQGLPDSALGLKAELKNHDGFLIGCPEYNSSITSALKNVIDWASRPAPNEEALACFKGKIAVLMSTSPGALGGMRGLVHVRAILSSIQVLVLPDQKSIPNAAKAFDGDGSLTDPKQQEAVMNLGAKLTQTVSKLR